MKPQSFPHSKPAKRVTICDLARELGLSNRAVSQALNPRESNVKLNPDTVKRIQELAVLRDYRPDSRARSMRYGRFFNIGYFEAKKAFDAWPILGAESGVFDAASEKNYRVVLIRLSSDPKGSPAEIPTTFRESNLDAMILSHAGSLSPELEEVVDHSGFPVVYLNEKKKTNAVYVDEARGAKEMTEHLISLGNRRIVYLGAVRDAVHYSCDDRWLGYKEAMKAACLKPEKCVVQGDVYGPQPKLLSWLGENRDVDAFVAYNDFIATLIFRSLYETSIKVPKDISVVGFGNDFARLAPVPLTTMQNPFYQMGRTAVEMALGLIDQNRKETPSIVFQSTLLQGDSVRKRRPA